MKFNLVRTCEDVDDSAKGAREREKEETDRQTVGGDGKAGVGLPMA